MGLHIEQLSFKEMLASTEEDERGSGGESHQKKVAKRKKREDVLWVFQIKKKGFLERQVGRAELAGSAIKRDHFRVSAETNPEGEEALLRWAKKGGKKVCSQTNTRGGRKLIRTALRRFPQPASTTCLTCKKAGEEGFGGDTERRDIKCAVKGVGYRGRLFPFPQRSLSSRLRPRAIRGRPAVKKKR